MKTQTTYTIKIHVKRLKKMLTFTAKSLDKYCPAAASFKAEGKPSWSYETDPCTICREFINLEIEGCPCTILGMKSARARTKEAIKKYDQANRK